MGYRVWGVGFRHYNRGWRVEWKGGRVVTALASDCSTTSIRWYAWGFRVQGLGFRVQGSGFRVQGLGFRV